MMAFASLFFRRLTAFGTGDTSPGGPADALLLEDGTGGYTLEDGTGEILMEV